MMDDLNKQIPVPKSWTDFENLCHRLFCAVWNDPYAEKNGRSGQKQNGVDIFGSPNQEYGTYHGVQCKGKNANYDSKADIKEIKREILKADQFTPTLRHWVYATTAPVDAKLQEQVRNLSVERKKKGLFTLSIFGWEQIESLLCEHKEVLKYFYPDLGFDLDTFVTDLKSTISTDLKEEINYFLANSHATYKSIQIEKNNGWIPINFGAGRGLSPALLGRSMGAEDAISCPKLPEVAGVIKDLSQAYATRIVGEPGSGKSLCAFQSMKYFFDAGWKLYRLVDSNCVDVTLPKVNSSEKTLLFIDDAHLLSAARLSVLEEQAGPCLYVLSTCNSEDGRISFRNAITIDSKRAVNAIAKALLIDPERTLKEVRKVDLSVGEKMMDVKLEERIADAQEHSRFPWQFSFNLGGGWRRSKNIADAARQAKADIVLAGLAIHQIASQDRPMDLGQAIQLLGYVNVYKEEIAECVSWLVGQRFLLSGQDLRMPHQRLAAVVLIKILQAQDERGRECVGKILQHTMSDGSYPLVGKRALLHELRFSGDYGRWTHLIPQSYLVKPIAECWRASTSEEKVHACYFLAELVSYLEGWPESLYQENEEVFASWLSMPEIPMGWGLAHVIYGIGNEHKDFLASIISKADPTILAKSLNCVVPTTAAHLGELICALGYVRDTTWYESFVSKIDRSALIKLAETWPDDVDCWAFSKLLLGVSSADKELGLLMADKFVPSARIAFDRDPILGFSELRDIMMFVLRVHDPLHVYVGKHAPKSQHRRIARKMLVSLDPKKVAQILSEVSLRKMQSAAELLATIYNLMPEKHGAIVEKIDWLKISESIGQYWDDLPHEAEVFIGVCFGNGYPRKILDQFILDNISKIKRFPPRLSIISPEAAIKHVESGKIIRLVQGDHIDWDYGRYVLALLSEKRPELLEKVLCPAEAATSKIFSRENHSWFGGAYKYIELINRVAPQSLQRILDGIDISGASKGWSDSLRHGKTARKSVALLVECALNRKDKLGELANSLRTQFPKASLVPEDF